jgi:hypothetical protein
MMRSGSHRELHRNERIGWLRAPVLGGNGCIPTAAIVMDIGRVIAILQRPV